MHLPLVAVALVHAQAAPPEVVRTVSPPVITTTRIARPSAPAGRVEDLAVRITAAGALLWEGTLRVGQHQGASYQQNMTQASVDRCAPDTPHDRSERTHLNFSIYAHTHHQWGQTYRVEVSWARPVRGEACLETGTRTVQINHNFMLEPGKTEIVDGDAGLRVALTRAR